MAYLNKSTEATTLIGEYNQLNSDNWTLDRVLTYVKYQSNLVVPYENILDNYNDYFDKYLIEVEIDSKYFYKPTMYAYYYYGDASFWWILLYYSKIPTALDFNKKKIKILPKDKLKDLNQIFINYKEYINEVNNTPLEF